MNQYHISRRFDAETLALSEHIIGAITDATSGGTAELGGLTLTAYNNQLQSEHGNPQRTANIDMIFDKHTVSIVEYNPHREQHTTEVELDEARRVYVENARHIPTGPEFIFSERQASRTLHGASVPTVIGARDLLMQSANNPDPMPMVVELRLERSFSSGHELKQNVKLDAAFIDSGDRFSTKFFTSNSTVTASRESQMCLFDDPRTAEETAAVLSGFLGPEDIPMYALTAQQWITALAMR